MVGVVIEKATLPVALRHHVQFRDIAMPKAQTDETRSNRLLGALEPAGRKRIDPHLQSVEFKLGAVVCEEGGLLKRAYFPRGSVLSLLTDLESGSAIETANIGRDPAVGRPGLEHVAR